MASGLPRPPSPRSVVLSLLALSVLVVSAYAAAPWLRRELHLYWLVHGDAVRQRQAIAFLGAHAPHDAKLRRRAVETVHDVKDEHLIEVAAGLREAGIWQSGSVPPKLWQRWAEELAKGDDPAQRLAAVDALLQLSSGVAPDAALPLRQLLQDDNESVRLAALLATGEMAGLRASEHLLVLLRGATHDSSPLLRRHAWLLLGLLSEAPTADGGNETDPAVIEAMRWAQGRLIPRWEEAEGPVHRWRAIVRAPVAEGLLREILPIVSEQPLRLALLHRLGDPSAAGSDLLEQVAATEGAPPGTITSRLAEDAPIALRLAWLAAASHPGAADFLPALLHEQPSVRDRAVCLAAARLSPGAAGSLAENLLRRFEPEARLSGAMLAGLLGVHAPLIQQRLEASPQWPEEPMLRLALWMQGHPAAAEVDPLLLLARRDLPGSTVLLAMLHRGGQRWALDALLAPHGQPQVDLPVLLVQQRWWEVLHPHLPADAPPLDYWADTSLTTLQLDVLRDWWVTRRGRVASSEIPR